MVNRLTYLLAVVVAVYLVCTTCEAHGRHQNGPYSGSGSGSGQGSDWGSWSYWFSDTNDPAETTTMDDNTEETSTPDYYEDDTTAILETETSTIAMTQAETSTIAKTQTKTKTISITETETAEPATSSVITTKPGDNLSTSSVSPLERAIWCRLANGSYYTLGYTYKLTDCVQCQCLQNRMLRCTALTCMVTYCIDGSTPVKYDGQCCTQCPGEVAAKSCTYQNETYAHGIVIKTQNNMQCWCQDGAIECRQAQGSLFDDFNLFGDNSYIYVIIIIVIGVLLVGSLLCCGCTVFFYYYYRKRQQTANAAQQQYWNDAGWQPMGEGDGTQPEGMSAEEEKQVEADQGQFASEQYLNGNKGVTAEGQQYMPPPYALYNGSYLTEDLHKQV
ncbi:unnamed protein product [Didymodactylos carnosus]|uniref:VWFC domain-containing protein n=1 Tax=Didymodactylos carnosus TaxID=1234261 RepID=A0A813U058_9BILA|nr:unnamed protein product [Didymodactylos carnosus]CAF1438853.1 unnamed protein product [Didymodactylos carnosus]CAF3602583.1 unnamed protein product [Didymodactylos carnosus]CAF4235586.1 unnamed protein product [Didymodactylos carnosus]